MVVPMLAGTLGTVLKSTELEGDLNYPVHNINEVCLDAKKTWCYSVYYDNCYPFGPSTDSRNIRMKNTSMTLNAAPLGP